MTAADGPRGGVVRPSVKFVAVSACLFCLVTASPAFALFGRGWLERLSGPGPFGGFTLDARFICLTAPQTPEQVSASQKELDSHGWAKKLTIPKETDRVAFASLVGCNFLSAKEPRLEIGLQYGRLHSTDNILDYSERGPLSDAEKKVKVRTLLITADIRVNRVLDVGAAIGWGSFNPGSDFPLFTGFDRTVTQPMRLTTRPLAAFSEAKPMGALVVRFDATKFHGGFTAEDFGAKPGTFNEPGEILWNWAVLVDLPALLWR